MKILYIDSGICTGHYLYYLNSLHDICKASGYDTLYLLSNNTHIDDEKTYNYTWNFDKPSFTDYCNLIKKIHYIVETENIDILHILSGDMFLRFFGIGMKKIRCKTIITMHKINNSFIKKISYKRIFKSFDAGVVHTKLLKEKLNNDYNLSNIFHIEYPCFTQMDKLEMDSREFWGIDEDIKVLSFIGGTRIDKGLDILLKSLNNVKSKFILLIAGVERGINRQYIEDLIKEYKKNVILKLDYLDDIELFHAFKCSDFIMLPYRKVFSGASGPLTEGVALGKTIIGPNHGSLGQIIRDNHIGYTFETENVEDLAKVIDKALSENFVYDDVANTYRESLKEENFQEKYKKLYGELV